MKSILPLMMLASVAGYGVNRSSYCYKKENEPMPLTDEEKEKLESLFGKAKKRYVRELRIKYFNLKEKRDV